MESRENSSKSLTIEDVQVYLPISWDRCHEISVRDAVMEFLGTLLSKHTRRSYAGAFEMFYKKRFLSPDLSLWRFATLNLEIILDQIRSRSEGSEATKQARSAAFIAWTSFLQRRTSGKIKKAITNTEKSNPTFKIERDKACSNALSTEQCYRFLDALKKMNNRDYLVAKTALQGAKRISEVINAQVEDIDWEKSRIAFVQLKSKERQKQTIITYPKSFMEELKQHIGSRSSGHIFLSRTGKPLSQPHLWRSFVSASRKARLPFNVHPHTLRATAITHFVERGYSAEQIAKVSGHASLKQVVYYDKSDMEKNLTTTVCLI